MKRYEFIKNEIAKKESTLRERRVARKQLQEELENVENVIAVKNMEIEVLKEELRNISKIDIKEAEREYDLPF
jgi:septal ring factor EnvC (AmiA/AmiB activator)